MLGLRHCMIFVHQVMLKALKQQKGVALTSFIWTHSELQPCGPEENKEEPRGTLSTSSAGTLVRNERAPQLQRVPNQGVPKGLQLASWFSFNQIAFFLRILLRRTMTPTRWPTSPAWKKRRRGSRRPSRPGRVIPGKGPRRCSRESSPFPQREGRKGRGLPH